MMQFSQLWGLAALVSVPLLVLLYIFRPRRETRLVPSNRLWREALQERQRGLGLQKLLRDLSLLLLVLFAIAVSLGLAGLGWMGHAHDVDDVVLVVDVSASMQARAQDGSTRLQLAKQQARDIVDGLDRNARLMLVSSGRNTLMRSTFESDRPTLERALDQLSATDESGNPREAISLALSLLRSRQQGKVYFITDGAFDDLGDLDTSRVEFRVIKGTSHNVAITRFDIRPEVGSEERHQLLVTARNYTSEPVLAALNIELDNQPLITRTLQLAADEERILVLPLEGRIAGVAKASIAYGDDFLQDNTAYAMVKNDEPMRVLRVGAQNIYLDSALSALPNVVTEHITEPGVDFSTRVATVDVVLLDRIVARQLPAQLPAGNYLLIDTYPAALPVGAGADILQPGISGDALDSLFSGIDLAGLVIDRARQIRHTTEPGGLQRLFWSGESDLALALVQDQLRVVMLGFDLADSNFPLQASFPLFLGESLAWLHPHQDRDARTQLPAGQFVTLALPEKNSSVRVDTPSGQALRFDSATTEFVFRDTSQAGIYRYAVGDMERRFAVNLTDETESDIRTRVAWSAAPAPVAATRTEGRVDIPLWPYLVAIGLVLLVLEWTLWCRGAR